MSSPRSMADRGFEALARSVRLVVPLSDAALAAWQRILVPRTFAAEAWLLREGDQAQLAYFLIDGLVREFYCDEQGAEHTRRFVCAGEMTGSLLDLLSDKPAVTYIQALEETHSLAFDY